MKKVLLSICLLFSLSGFSQQFSSGGIPVPASGVGSVSSVTVTPANGVSGTVANPTTTPAISLTLGAITPTSVNGNTISTGTGTLSLSTYSVNAGANATISGVNTGDQTTISGNAGNVTGIVLPANGGTGIANSYSLNVGANSTINGSSTGINTGDQTTISGNAGNITGVAAIANGGTGQATSTLGFNALSPVTTRGDIIARGATNNQRLALGGAGTILRSDGTDLVYSTATYPNTITANQLLYATGTNVLGSSGNLTFDGNNLAQAGTTNTAINLSTTATGTTGYGTQYSINTTNGAYVQSVAYGSAASGTDFALNRTGSANILMNPATGGVGVIGTISAFPLVFGSNNVERMRFLSSGEVLWGETSLFSSSVAEWRKDQNNVTAITVINGTSGTVASSQINTYNAGSRAFGLMNASALYTSAGIYQADCGVLAGNTLAGMNIGNTGSTQLSFWTNNTKQLSIHGTTGAATFTNIVSATQFQISGTQITQTALSDYVAPVAVSSPTFTGWTVNSGAYYTYCKIGKKVTIWFGYQATSNATTITITLPVAMDATEAASGNEWGSGIYKDASINADAVTSGLRINAASTTVINVIPIASTGVTTWTASGNKYVSFSIEYISQ